MYVWIKIIALVLALSVLNICRIEAATLLSWNSPTKNTDGSILDNLKNFKIYWGTASKIYANSQVAPACVDCPIPTGTQANVSCLALEPGNTYYFAVTAINSYGDESAHSSEVSKTIPPVSGILGNIDTVSPGSATRVDGFDLIYLSKCFGAGITGLSCTETNFYNWQNGCDKADINYDGKVDGSDYTILHGNFGL